MPRPARPALPELKQLVDAWFAQGQPSIDVLRARVAASWTGPTAGYVRVRIIDDADSKPSVEIEVEGDGLVEQFRLRPRGARTDIDLDDVVEFGSTRRRRKAAASSAQVATVDDLAEPTTPTIGG